MVIVVQVSWKGFEQAPVGKLLLEIDEAEERQQRTINRRKDEYWFGELIGYKRMRLFLRSNSPGLPRALELYVNAAGSRLTGLIGAEADRLNRDP